MNADLRSAFHVHIIGLGLIGGSIGLGLRAAGPRWRVTGEDVSAEIQELAVDRGAIAGDLSDRSPDLLVLAVPPGAFASVVSIHQKLVSECPAWTDVCSVKSQLAAQVPESLAEHWVPGHPMAGAEVGGIRQARADLFHGAPWAIVDDGRPAAAVERVRELIRTLRGIPVSRSAEEHDAEVALTSHLPHALATQLLHLSATTPAELAGGSWRDATRVGGAEPDLWTEIFTHNAEAIEAKLKEMENGLAQLRAWIGNEDHAAIRQWLEDAQEIKRQRS